MRFFGRGKSGAASTPEPRPAWERWIKNPQWSGGLAPRRQVLATHVVPDLTPATGIVPGSGLYQLLTSPGMTRSLRRLTLAVVQGKPTPRRARLERRANRQLSAIGIRLS